VCRKQIGVALAVAAAAVGVAGGAHGLDAAAAPKASCRTRGDTLLANTTVRVFEVPARAGFKSLLVCAGRRGRAYRIALDDETSRLVVAGHDVAYELDDCTSKGCSDGIHVRDAVTGRERLVPAAPDQPAPAAGNLALTPTGTLAWPTSRIVGNGGQIEHAVWLLGPTGDPQRLDAGPDVELGSVAISENFVYWTRGGVPRSAPLP
jgi:hypothetical protein